MIIFFTSHLYTKISLYTVSQLTPYPVRATPNVGDCGREDFIKINLFDQFRREDTHSYQMHRGLRHEGEYIGGDSRACFMLT